MENKMPIPATIELPTREKYRIALEPAQNALASMVLVTKQEEMPGISPWVAKTRASMTAEEINRHRLVIIGFYYAILPEAGLASFPDYLTKLENTDPAQLVNKLLEAYLEINLQNNPEKKKESVHWDQVLSSAEEYVKFLSEGFEDNLIDVKIETKAYEYVTDPPALKNLLAQHLRWFWDEHLAKEWARVEPILLETIKAFQAVNLKNKNELEIARYITGQDLDETSWQECLKSGEVITYIPNPHVGPYVHKNSCFPPRALCSVPASQRMPASVSPSWIEQTSLPACRRLQRIRACTSCK